MSKTNHKSVEEFSVKTLEIGGLYAALQALRLPFGNEAKSSGHSEHITFSPAMEYNDGLSAEEYYDGHKFITLVLAHSKDIVLLQKLVKRGDEHAKVLRGVVVWCEINAPRYWWQECDRYSVGACCLSSNSTMHQQGRGLDEDTLVEMKENLPEGTMQKRVWAFSYQTLRRIYYQRRNHRLPQWRMFCRWIEGLPYSNEFILAGLDEQSN